MINDDFNILRDILPGSLFLYGDLRWIKLEDMITDGTLCLLSDIVCTKEFDIDNCNDWRTSSLRKWLNSNFIERLGKARICYFKDIISDLTADDGMTEYETATDKIALLTRDMYRKYRNIILPIDTWYWTLTAWTCQKKYNYNVCGIGTWGTFNNSIAYDNSKGVRPICCLQSDIMITNKHTTAEYEKFMRLVIESESKDAYRIKN